MTTTPWGESEALRDRSLRPGPGVPREKVELNQRERLYGATVAVVASKGYAESTIADVIAVAGLSRTTFYKYFADKEACFLATLEVIVGGVTAVTAERLRGEGRWRRRAERGLGAFIELLVDQPDAARLCVVEAYAAGPRALAIVDAAAAEFEEMMAAVFEKLPAQRGIPPEMVEAMVGGVRKVLHTRLHRGNEGELRGMAEHLVELGLLYGPPPRPMLRASGRRTERKRSSAGREGPDEPAERIERATMAVVARQGYADATMAAIVSEAGVSLRTFYSVFAGKAEAFDNALFRCGLRMSAATLPAYRRAETWPEAIAAIVKAGIGFLESEPDFARMITIDVYRAGGEALEARDQAIESARRFIEADPRYPRIENPIAAEAIESVLYSLLSARVRQSEPNDLRQMAPLAIYMVLTPFLGAEDAYHFAMG